MRITLSYQDQDKQPLILRHFLLSSSEVGKVTAEAKAMSGPTAMMTK